MKYLDVILKVSLIIIGIIIVSELQKIRRAGENGRFVLSDQIVMDTRSGEIYYIDEKKGVYYRTENDYFQEINPIHKLPK